MELLVSYIYVKISTPEHQPCPQYSHNTTKKIKRNIPCEENVLSVCQVVAVSSSSRGNINGSSNKTRIREFGQAQLMGQHPC